MLVKISVNAYIYVVHTLFTVVSLTKARYSLSISILQIHWKYNSKVYLKYTSSILPSYLKYTSSILQVYISSIFQPVELQRKKYTSFLYHFNKRSTFEAHFVKLSLYF